MNTMKQIRKLIREVITTLQPVEIGSLYASIGFDDRYRDILKVYIDPTTRAVTVVVTSTSAVGGSDGPGGATAPDEVFRESTAPNPKIAEVMRLIKRPISDPRMNFKRYGKPSKNFIWQFSRDVRGLNQANLTQALASVDASGQLHRAHRTDHNADVATFWNAMNDDDRRALVDEELDGFDREDRDYIANVSWHELRNEIGESAQTELASSIRRFWMPR